MRDLSQRKVVKKFLLFPMRIGEEVRWLETATIQMRPNIFSETLWTPDAFVDDSARHSTPATRHS